MPVKRVASFLWREWIRPFAILFVVVAPLKSAVVDWNWVPTGSMKPTILEGDLVLVNKLAYDLRVPFTKIHLSTWAEPARGDIAVFFSPADGTRLVKRVIGLPGDIVELRNGVLIVNGTPARYAVQEPAEFQRALAGEPSPVVAIEELDVSRHYVMTLPGRTALRTFGPHSVPPGHYFMMGDSRDNSFDSRFFGVVPRDEIVGRANAVLISVDPSRYLQPRLNRFARSLELEARL